MTPTTRRYGISDEADPPRPPVDRGARIFLAIAAATSIAWGAWLAYALHAWAKTF